MSYQQCTIGEICSELLEEAIRIGYSKRYVWGQLSKCLSIIRGYYRNHHICTFSIEATKACLASYRNKYEQGITSRTSFKDLFTAVRRLEEYTLKSSVPVSSGSAAASGCSLSEAAFPRGVDRSQNTSWVSLSASPSRQMRRMLPTQAF